MKSWGAGPLWRRLLLALAGIMLGLLFLFLAARKSDLAAAARLFSSADPRWIWTGVVLFGIGMLVRVVRWRGILAHKSMVMWSHVTLALYAGYAMNCLLTARLGELFRVDYLARLTHLRRSAILASIFIERLLDLLAVVLLLLTGLLLIGARNPTLHGVDLAGAILVGLGLTVLAVAILDYPRKKFRDVLLRIADRVGLGIRARRIVGAGRIFADLLRIVGTRRFACAAGWTVVIWMMEAPAVYCVCRSIGVPLTLLALVTLVGGSSLSTLLPTAPGYVGSFQLAYVIVLQLFQISETAALAASTAVQVYLIGVSTVVGLILWFAVILYSAGKPTAVPKELETISDARRT